MAYRRGAFALTAPSVPLFGVSLALAAAALLAHYGGVSIPWVSAHVFDTLTIAFAIMTAGVVARGI